MEILRYLRINNINKDMKINCPYLHQFYKKTSKNIEVTVHTSSLSKNYKTAVNVLAVGMVSEF